MSTHDSTTTGTCGPHSSAREPVSEAKRNGVQRRSVVRGAAWTLPVIAVGAALPSAAASTANQDVVISSICGGFRTTVAHFSALAVGAPIKEGSTFILRSTATFVVGDTTGADVRIGPNSAFTTAVASNKKTVTFTLAKDIPAGQAQVINFSSILAVFALATFTFTVGTIIGNTNLDTTNDSSSLSITGVKVSNGVFAGTCSSTTSQGANVDG